MSSCSASDQIGTSSHSSHPPRTEPTCVPHDLELTCYSAAGQAAATSCASVGVTINPVAAAPATSASPTDVATAPAEDSATATEDAATSTPAAEDTATATANATAASASATTLIYSNATMPTAGMWASPTASVEPYAGRAGRNVVGGVGVGVLAFGVLFL
jgi:uncharacterized membrane protein